MDLSQGRARITPASPIDAEPSRTIDGVLACSLPISWISVSTSARNSSVEATIAILLPSFKASNVISAAWAAAIDVPFRSAVIISIFNPATIAGRATRSTVFGESLHKALSVKSEKYQTNFRGQDPKIYKATIVYALIAKILMNTPSCICRTDNV